MKEIYIYIFQKCCFSTTRNNVKKMCSNKSITFIGSFWNEYSIIKEGPSIVKNMFTVYRKLLMIFTKEVKIFTQCFKTIFSIHFSSNLISIISLYSIQPVFVCGSQVPLNSQPHLVINLNIMYFHAILYKLASAIRIS